MADLRRQMDDVERLDGRVRLGVAGSELRSRKQVIIIKGVWPLCHLFTRGALYC